MIKILHFADAHIDMANFGRFDPESGLPMRVMDFLKSLDEIVDAAVNEKVDMVVFAGDTYKDRAPVPTFQREWGRRIMRLSRAGIPTLLLTGNHDISPSLTRAHAIQEFDTLEVPFVHVVNKPSLLSPKDLDGLPLQVIALPWVTRSGLMAALNVNADNQIDVLEALEERLTAYVQASFGELDPSLPTVLVAHASIEGAKYGNERTIMLGKDVVLSRSLVCDPRLDYVALGHIHKAQNLNENAHPPVIYPGSIERVDFGEAKDDKFYVIAEVSKGETRVNWRQLKNIRRFIDLEVSLTDPNTVNKVLQETLLSKGDLSDAIVRMVVNYPSSIEGFIDEQTLRKLSDKAFEFYLVKRPQSASRIRLPEGRETSSMTALELLDLYWKSSRIPEDERDILSGLAKNIIQGLDEEVD